MRLPGTRPARRLQPLPTLALAALIALTVFGASGSGTATAAVGDCAPGAGWGTVRPDLGAQVVSLVNDHRTSLGLGALAEAPALTAAAMWKTQHMAFYGYMSHNDPAPPIARSVGDRLAACGYTASGWGENIAEGQPSAAAVMQAWLGSSGHRANIERSSFRAIGVGVTAAANGRLYWVQAFGTVADGASPPPAPPPPPSPPPPTPAPAPAPPAPASPRTPHAEPVAGGKLEASTLLQWGGRPRAGRTYTARLTISVPATRQRLRTGHATCKAGAGGRPVWVGIHRFRNGFVVCRWQLPRTAKGKRMIGMIRVTAGGKRTARWFSRLVR